MEPGLRAGKTTSTNKKTESDVRCFTQYLANTGLADPTPQHLSEAVLTQHLCEFFKQLKKADGGDYEPTTLEGMYSSVKRYLKCKNYSFKNSESLSEVSNVIKEVCNKLKEKGHGNLPRKSDSLTISDIKKLYDVGAAGWHNPRAVTNAMAMNCTFLGFRGGRELYDRCLGDFHILTSNGVRYLTIVKERVKKNLTLDYSKEKTYGNLQLPEIPDSDRCPVKVYNTIVQHRPDRFEGPDSPLFLRPYTTNPLTQFDTSRAWFYNHHMGIKEVGRIIKQMCTASKLDFNGRHITNTSTRKTITTSLQMSNEPLNHIMEQISQPGQTTSTDRATRAIISRFVPIASADRAEPGCSGLANSGQSPSSGNKQTNQNCLIVPISQIATSPNLLPTQISSINQTCITTRSPNATQTTQTRQSNQKSLECQDNAYDSGSESPKREITINLNGADTFDFDIGRLIRQIESSDVVEPKQEPWEGEGPAPKRQKKSKIHITINLNK